MAASSSWLLLLLLLLATMAATTATAATRDAASLVVDVDADVGASLSSSLVEYAQTMVSDADADADDADAASSVDADVAAAVAATDPFEHAPKSASAAASTLADGASLSSLLASASKMYDVRAARQFLDAHVAEEEAYFAPILEYNEADVLDDGEGDYDYDDDDDDDDDDVGPAGDDHDDDLVEFAQENEDVQYDADDQRRFEAELRSIGVRNFRPLCPRGTAAAAVCAGAIDYAQEYTTADDHDYDDVNPALVDERAAARGDRFEFEQPTPDAAHINVVDEARDGEGVFVHCPDGNCFSDEGDIADKYFATSMPDDGIAPPPVYYDKQRYKIADDARALCTAMDRIGTDNTALSRIVLSSHRSYGYLSELKSYWDKNVRCDGKKRSLVAWIKSETSCSLRIKLVKSLTERRYKMEVDREQAEMEFRRRNAAQKGSGATVGDQHRVDKQISLLAPRDTDSVLRACGKGLLKGVKDAVVGYIDIAKMGWKAFQALRTDFWGSMGKVVCAVSDGVKWVWGKVKSGTKVVLSKAWGAIKSLPSALRSYASDSCKGVSALRCVFNLATRAPTQLIVYVVRKIVAAFMYVWKHTLGKFFYQMSGTRRAHLLCWTMGMFAVELALIPLVPFVFGWIAQKLALLSSKLIPILAKLLPGVSKAMLHSTLVGRWSSKTLMKHSVKKLAKARHALDKATDATKIAKAGKGKTNVIARTRAKRASKKLAAKADEVAALEKQLLKHQRDLRAGMGRLRVRDVRLKGKLSKRVDALTSKVETASRKVESFTSELAALERNTKLNAAQRATKHAQLTAERAVLRKRLAYLRARKAGLAKQQRILKETLDGAPLLTQEARRKMYRALARANPGFVRRTVLRTGKYVKMIGKRIAASPIAGLVARAATTPFKAIGRVHTAMKKRISAWVERAVKAARGKRPHYAYSVNKQTGKVSWVNKATGKAAVPPPSLGARLFYRPLPEALRYVRVLAKRAKSATMQKARALASKVFRSKTGSHLVHGYTRFFRARADWLLRRAKTAVKQADSLAARATQKHASVMSTNIPQLRSLAREIKATRNPLKKAVLQRRRTRLSAQLKSAEDMLNMAKATQANARVAAQSAAERTLTMRNLQMRAIQCSKRTAAELATPQAQRLCGHLGQFLFLRNPTVHLSAKTQRKQLKMFFSGDEARLMALDPKSIKANPRFRSSTTWNRMSHTEKVAVLKTTSALTASAKAVFVVQHAHQTSLTARQSDLLQRLDLLSAEQRSIVGRMLYPADDISYKAFVDRSELFDPYADTTRLMTLIDEVDPKIASLLLNRRITKKSRARDREMALEKRVEHAARAKSSAEKGIRQLGFVLSRFRYTLKLLDYGYRRIIANRVFGCSECKPAARNFIKYAYMSPQHIVMVIRGLEHLPHTLHRIFQCNAMIAERTCKGTKQLTRVPLIQQHEAATEIVAPSETAAADEETAGLLSRRRESVAKIAPIRLKRIADVRVAPEMTIKKPADFQPLKVSREQREAIALENDDDN